MAFCDDYAMRGREVNSEKRKIEHCTLRGFVIISLKKFYVKSIRNDTMKFVFFFSSCVYQQGSGE